jgi:hypothetical protein
MDAARDPGTRARGLLGCGALACWLWLALAGLLPCAGHAWAAVGHGFISSLSEAPLGTRLEGPEAVAVDGATGEVFVGDVYSGYVDVYSSGGAYETRLGGGFVDAAGIAVDEGSGDIYVAEPEQDVVLVYGPNGEGGYRLRSRWSGQGIPGKGFGEVAGVAVDNSRGPSTGDVYVVEPKALDGEGGAVDVFKPAPNPEDPDEVGEGEGQEGGYLRRLSGTKLEGANGVVVSPSTGRVLVADSFKGAIYAYTAEGAYEEKVNGKGSPYGPFAKEAAVGDAVGVGVDETSGDIYVAEGERHVVSQYGPTGEWEGWITGTSAGGLGEPRGVAAAPSGEVYVADTSMGVVDRFATGVVVPSVETGKVAKSAPTRTTALLPGTVNGEGKPTSYRFQYGETEALGSETGVKASGAGLEAVASTASGLHAGRVYYYRIVGEDEDGTNYGVVRTLETPPAVDGLETGPVMNVKPESVTLTVRHQRKLRVRESRPAGGSTGGPRRKGRKRAPNARHQHYEPCREHALPLPAGRRKRIRHDLRSGPHLHDLRTAEEQL